ncbi:MAG: type II toxin-antitoxin system HicB family antitoxin [Devosia sp.]
MARYLAIIDEADGSLGAYFPDAPGCVAMGESEDEVIDNATDALSEWAADVLASGGKLPPPRSYAELLKAGEFGPGKGGVVAHIPLLLETGKLARANISLDAGLLADIDEAAARRGVTRSAFLASAAREKIKAGA